MAGEARRRESESSVVEAGLPTVAGARDTEVEAGLLEEQCDPAVRLVFTLGGVDQEVWRAGRLGRGNSLGSHTHPALLPGLGKLVAVARWELHLPHPSLARQLAGLEQEMAGLVRLPPHPNLVSYLGIQHGPHTRPGPDVSQLSKHISSLSNF